MLRGLDARHATRLSLAMTFGFLGGDWSKMCDNSVFVLHKQRLRRVGSCEIESDRRMQSEWWNLNGYSQ